MQVLIRLSPRALTIVGRAWEVRRVLAAWRHAGRVADLLARRQ